MKQTMTLTAVAAAIFLCQGRADAQHLWWNLEGQGKATCLYGEITVLATHWCIYYCGANWHPGEPAGGYCGIQHNGPQEKRTIFSIWDTLPQLHPRVSGQPGHALQPFRRRRDRRHTHMLWPWKEGDTFQFFVCKRPGKGDRPTPATMCSTAREEVAAQRDDHLSQRHLPERGHHWRRRTGFLSGKFRRPRTAAAKLALIACGSAPSRRI